VNPEALARAVRALRAARRADVDRPGPAGEVLPEPARAVDDD
jgi:hypothetical protein